MAPGTLDEIQDVYFLPGMNPAVCLYSQITRFHLVWLHAKSVHGTSRGGLFAALGAEMGSEKKQLGMQLTLDQLGRVPQVLL